MGFLGTGGQMISQENPGCGWPDLQVRAWHGQGPGQGNKAVGVGSSFVVPNVGRDSLFIPSG